MEDFASWEKRADETRRLTSLADAADALASSVDLKRVPNGHIYRALDRAGIRDRNARRALIGPIKAELYRRHQIRLADARRHEEANTQPEQEDNE